MIAGAPHNPYALQPELRYTYVAGDAMQSCACPGCGGLGQPWAGWFTCGECPLLAVVEDGRCFMPAITPVAQ